MSNELMKVALSESASVVIEVDADDPGFRPASRRDQIAQAAAIFDAGFDEIIHASQRTLSLFQSGDLDPDEIELTFGVKINAEVGAVLAKVAGEGHIAVRLMWAKPKS